jgi:hypothetical protein
LDEETSLDFVLRRNRFSRTWVQRKTWKLRGRERERERERESRGGFEGAWKVEIWVLVALFLPA